MKKIICIILCSIISLTTFTYAETTSKVWEKFGEQIADNYVSGITNLYRYKEEQRQRYTDILKNKKSTISEKTEACFGLGHSLDPLPGKIYDVGDYSKNRKRSGNYKEAFELGLKNGKYYFYISKNNKIEEYKIKVDDVYLFEQDNVNKNASFIELKCNTCNKKDRKMLCLPKDYKIVSFVD